MRNLYLIFFSIVVSGLLLSGILYFGGRVLATTLDSADTSNNWISSDSTVLDVSQESGIVQEGTGSVKLSSPSWYNYSWPYRIKLTIEADYVDADLTDFPVYVDLNDLPASFHTNVNQTDARDIRVTKGDGTTELPREIVFYNATSDIGELHFKYSGTLFDTTDTDVYIYYGNAGASDYGATDTYGRNNVWDSNYIGVYHLHESSGTHYSSTGSHDSTSVAVTQQGANIGQLYTADEFASTNDISFADDNAYSINTTNQFSAEAWVKVDSLSARQEPLNKGTSSNYEWGLRIETSGSLRPTIYTSSGGDHMTCIASSQVSTSTWYYLVLTSNLTTPRTEVYNNGTSVCNDTTTSGSYTNGTSAMRIGERADFSNDTDGTIDEVRFSDVARSSAWVSTQYNNQYSPGTFFNSFGSEETILGQTATRTVTATDLSSYDSITYWVRSDRTGNFMRFQFGESASSEQTNSITINSANTWEQKTWNISGISGTARDAVTKYAFYVTDASADFDFYFDDVQASINNSPPNTPALDSPADTTTNQSLATTLLTTTTDTDSDYLRYKIELCENVGMSTNCQTFDQTSSQTGWSGQNTETSTAYTSGTQATYTIQSPLTANFTYYWRSYSIDPGGANTWSSTQGSPYSFTTTTAPSAPTTPYTEGTTNPTGIVDLTPEFSAIHSDSNSDPAVYYEIEVNTASDFTGTIMWDTGQTAMSSLASGDRSTDVSYAGTTLSYNGTTYYWRIRFTDNKGAVGSWSATQTFSTNSPPSTPSLDSPADTASNQSLTPSLLTTTTDTNSDYLRYKIELCENVGMSTNCQTFDQTSSQTGWSGQNTQSSTAYTSGTQATYTLQSALSPATTYYWQSYAIDPGGANTWSSTQGTPYSFTTLAGGGGGTDTLYGNGVNFSGITIE